LPADFAQRNFFATTTNPTSTDNHTTYGLQLLGSCWSSTPTNEQGTCIGNSFHIANNALQVTQRASSMRGGDRIGMAAMASLKSNDAFASGSTRFGDYAVSVTGNIYLVVGIGIKTNTTVITAGNQCFFRLRYIAHTIDSGEI
jgi:hypothetical protein